MKLLFFGPQGSGKGTQAKIISARLGIPHISTGDLLRNATGELAKKIHSYIDGGGLFPDEGMLEILEERLAQKDCLKGYILDGFPRNMRQARMLDGITSIDRAIEIYIPDEEAVLRTSSRRSCPSCGRIYNLTTKPVPKTKGICDADGAKLAQREDDREEAIRKRLATYHKETEPVLKHYGAIRVDGNRPIEVISEDIVKVLNN
jgi:adenylate kinase